ncbi:MAG: T9SS type A sorting domain-containing protein [Bacteroidota bacterium]
MERTLRWIRSWTPVVGIIGVGLLAGVWTASAQSVEGLRADSPMNLLSNGGFEASSPHLWEATGAGAEWSMEQSRTPDFSLKLSGSGAAHWQQPEAVQHWVSRILGNLEIVVGGWVYTEGVNTDPASDDEKFQLVFEFFDASGADLLGEPLVLDLPQDQASTGGWVEIDNTAIGSLSLPGDATSARISFRKGADATGTAYLDDLFLRKADPEAEGWPGGFFNTNMDMGDGWYYWWPDFDQGLETWPDEQFFIQTMAADASHSGSHGLLMEEQIQSGNEVVAISERVPVTPGEPMLVSYWVRHAGVPSPETIGEDDNNIGMTVLWYEQMEAGAAGYGEMGGLDIRLNGEYNPAVIPLAVQETDSDWTQYAFIVYPREGAAGMELRLRYWHGFEGTTHWDDVFVAPVSSVLGTLPNLVSNGGFEASSPHLWEATGAGAEWSMEQSRTPDFSLKLSGSGAAHWQQPEAVQHWVSRILGNLEIVVGGWVYTEGVNTDPASDDEKFQLVFEFFDASGADLLGEPLVLDLPQDQASTGGWVEIDNTAIGSLSLPGDATSARISFRKGADATGTAYLDDLFLRKADPEAEGWPGGFFNTNMDMGDGWYYWWPDFDQGLETWPDEQFFIQTMAADASHSGSHGLLMEEQIQSGNEVVAISERVPVTPGEPMLVSYWVRHAGVPSPETIGEDDNNIGMTVLWYEQMEAGAAGYGEMGGLDIRLNGEYNPAVIPLAVQETDSDWTQYAFIVYPREGAAGMELRLRYWHGFEGTTHWDDVAIVNIGGEVLTATSVEDPGGDPSELPRTILLEQNYPNPFNPSTTVPFTLPAAMDVTLEVYNLLGQRVATLIDGQQMPSGRHAAVFDAASLPTGVYLYQLRAGHQIETRKMLLIK